MFSIIIISKLTVLSHQIKQSRQRRLRESSESEVKSTLWSLSSPWKQTFKHLQLFWMHSLCMVRLW